MSTYDFVHLVLLAFDGSIEGRTKLQKTVYFVGELTRRLPDLGYRPHFYGPYSGEVAAAVQDLRGFGFLEQTTASAGTADPRGFEITRFDYRLTQQGRDIAEDKAKRFPEEWAQIRKVADLLRTFPDADYIKLSIAAKMLHLLGERDRATAEELTEMAPRFGWSVTAPQMNEAGQFLQQLGLIDLVESS